METNPEQVPAPPKRGFSSPIWAWRLFNHGNYPKMLSGRPERDGYNKMEWTGDYARRFTSYHHYLSVLSGVMDSIPCRGISGTGPLTKDYLDCPYFEVIWIREEIDPIYSEFLPVRMTNPIPSLEERNRGASWNFFNMP